MTFYAALSVNPSQIRKTFARLEQGYRSLDPLQNIMFTPISQGESSHREIRNIVDRFGVDVMFDSGGYEVQVGNYEFDELYSYLINFYNANRWGQRYVLPDNVPVTGDAEDLVDQKVNETISASRMCFRRLPDEVRSNAVAVVQGHTKEQISRCLEAYVHGEGYEELNHLGFGSFGTSGASNGVNMLTKEAYNNLEWAVGQAHDAGLSVHAFGVGGPTSIPLLAEAGVDSFDTTSWMRSSGYGNVFFPFKSRYNASHRKKRGGKILTEEELPHLRAETNHSCPFCDEMQRLRNNRWDRIMHNLIVIHEMTEQVENMSSNEIINAMDPNSTYRKRLEKIHNTPRVTG